MTGSHNHTYRVGPPDSPPQVAASNSAVAATCTSQHHRASSALPNNNDSMGCAGCRGPTTPTVRLTFRQVSRLAQFILRAGWEEEAQPFRGGAPGPRRGSDPSLKRGSELASCLFLGGASIPFLFASASSFSSFVSYSYYFVFFFFYIYQTCEESRCGAGWLKPPHSGWPKFPAHCAGGGSRGREGAGWA